MKYNELYDLLMKFIKKSLDAWLKTHKNENKLILAQQLFLVGGKIRDMGSKMQESSRYK
jgi:hypothetical protein